jgi:hypothetical protein
VVGYTPGLRDIRAEFSDNEDQWKLVYQQQDVELGGSVFTQDHVDKALELGKDRNHGQYYDHERLILAVDPATSGRAAALVIAVDPTSKIRTVIDGFTATQLGAVGLRKQLFYRFWEKYRDHGIALTVVETNFSPTLMGDEAFLTQADTYGTYIEPFRTKGRGRGRGVKWDEEYGVGGMASQFSSGMIAFANKDQAGKDMVQPLIGDMLVFPYEEPTGDSLMALWFGITNADLVYVARDFDQYESQKRRGVPPYLLQRNRH